MDKQIILNDFDGFAKDELDISGHDDPCGCKGTEIIITNEDTGEELFRGHNRKVIAGAQFEATKLWGLSQIVNFPDYNAELGLDNSSQRIPDNDPIVCLFAVGIDGCGRENSQRYPVPYTSHIPHTSLIPFRYEKGADLPYEQRGHYFGRKVVGDEENENVRYAYYYKAIESKQIHMRFIDGTDVTSELYNQATSMRANTYVEAQLKISKSDCRDIFSSGDFVPMLGDGTYPATGLSLGDARFNSITLLQAWYKTQTDKEGNVYKFYQNVKPVSVLHTNNIDLIDSTLGLSILYRMYY